MTWIKRNLFGRQKSYFIIMTIGLCLTCSLWLLSTEVTERRSEVTMVSKSLNIVSTQTQSYQLKGMPSWYIRHSETREAEKIMNKNSQLVLNRDSLSVEDRRSYELWKAIKLKPVYKKGKMKHVRFGEPLQLYAIQTPRDRAGQLNQKLFNVSAFPSSNGMVDCKGLILGRESVSNDKQSLITASIKLRFKKVVQNATDSCNNFRHYAGYVTSSLTPEEASFPIAFSILVFKDYEQFEILLRSIYRPQNIYCVHIDKKSSNEFRQTVENLLTCFNVFITSTSIDVEWGTFTVLEPDIICLRELFYHNKKWKYFINLTGQELPLRTNYEIVKILKAFNGANNVEASKIEYARLKDSGPPPHGVNSVKGAVHVMLSRAFVDFMLNNQTALDIYEWSKHVSHASEVLFSTLNYNPLLAATGSYKGPARSNGDKNPLLARLKNWGSESHCSGKLNRRICILSPGELPLIATREELFANKFHFNYHPEMLVCVPELIFNRTVDEYNGLLLFNDTYYKTRDFVTNRF